MMDRSLWNHGMLGSWLIGEAEEAAAREVVRSRSLFRYYGPQLLGTARRFEQATAQQLGTAHALAVCSGTAALRCALVALGVSPGDEIIVPPCTFAATVNAVVLAGAIPVFAEIDDSLGLDPKAIEERVSSATVGIIPVHLQGMACRIEELSAVARRRGLWLLEDAAQAFGCRYGGRHLGTFGALGAFSLQAHKVITCGEGGVLVTNDGELYAQARRFHDQGGERAGDEYPSWEHPDAGFGENLKMSELHAAVALAQLGRLESIASSMRSAYTLLAAGVNLRGRAARVNIDPEGAIPFSFTFFAQDAEDRGRLFERLHARGIPADGLYDTPLYRSGPFVRWARGQRVLGAPARARPSDFLPCPRSEALMCRIVRIPLNPTLTGAELERAAEDINRAILEVDG